MKKILKSFFAMMMVLCLGTTSFAQPTKSAGTITIQNDSKATGISMVGHTYSVYNVFNATISDGGDKYSYSVSDEFKAYFEAKATEAKADISTLSKFNKFAVEYVDSFKDNMQELTKDLRNYVIEQNTKPLQTSEKATEEKVVISGLPLGYYLILDNGNGSTTSESNPIAAAALGTTSNELVINLKGSAPTIDKEIKHNENGDWGNVGDNQIGDTVEYRLTATIPSDLTGYENYTYIIHDTLSKGLTFNDDIEIYVGEKDNGGKKLESDYTVINPTTDNHTFDINVDILNGIKTGKFEEGNKLYIYYSAVLNEDALIAGDSNDNTVDLEYSNNPYDEDSKDKTPEVTVKDYTFKINALKTKEDGKTALEGAEFELSTKDGESIYFNLTITGDGTSKYVVCADKHTHSDAENKCIKTIISPENGKFEMVGLDDAVEYTLTETKAPDGYNPIDPIKFIITATYDEKGNITGIETNVDGINKVNGTFELGTTIINTTGDKLPETGGIGTTIFKVAGISLMAVAAVLLITRYRLN
ncbi:MAG: SpaH/EbpB family LPXTG-anchored major pilin [Peptostreptococcaceae bacterium]